MTDKKKEFTQHRFVCIGNRMGSDGMLYTALRELVRGDLNAEEQLFKKLRLWVGGVYDIKASSDSIQPSTATYVDRWHDAEAAAGWDARSQAEATRWRLHKDGRREGAKGEALRKLLAPVRAEYYKTDQLGKKAIEVALLDALRSPFL